MMTLFKFCATGLLVFLIAAFMVLVISVTCCAISKIIVELVARILDFIEERFDDFDEWVEHHKENK